MDKPPTEKYPGGEFPLFSSMKWDTLYASTLSQYGFLKDDNIVRSELKQSSTPGKMIIAAIIIVIIILAYTIILLSIPVSVFYGSDESSMQLNPSLALPDSVAQAEEKSDSALLAEMMRSDAGEQISQKILAQDSDIPPVIRLVESPLVIAQ